MAPSDDITGGLPSGARSSTGDMSPTPEPVAPMNADPSVFTAGELSYLHDGRRLGRIATVGSDGTPHVVPVGWSHNTDVDTIDISGHSLVNTKKFRDVARTGRAAIVIDDLASTNPFRPRAVEVRGRADAITGPLPIIRIHPERIVSWGIDPQRNARTTTRPRPGPKGAASPRL